MGVWHWFLHVTGSDNVSGKWYGFWSGFGGDLTLFGAAIAVIRHHTCHVNGCWRLGKHPHDQYKLCSRHHPHVPDEGPTAEHIEASA